MESSILVGVEKLHEQSLTATNQLLKLWSLTSLQYNTLRILYVLDQDGQGLPSGEIGKHLSTRVPDVTRLLDRMADRGWIERERDDTNRRIVRSRLTSIGVELVESAYVPLMNRDTEQFDHMTDDEKALLAELLDKALRLKD